MHLTPMAHLYDTERRDLASTVKLVLGKTDVEHIAKRDVKDTFDSFMKILNETEAGQHADLMNKILNESPLVSGDHLFKITGSDELGNTRRGMYEYLGHERNKEGVDIKLKDLSITEGDSEVVLHANNMNHAKTIMARDFARVNKEDVLEIESNKDRFIFEDVQRNIEKARGSFDSFGAIRENAEYVTDPAKALSRIDNTIAKYRALGNESLLDELLIQTSKRGSLADHLTDKRDELVKRYPNGQITGMQKQIQEQTAEWFKTNEALVTEDAKSQIKTLLDSGWIDSTGAKEITTGINEAIKSKQAVRKTSFYNVVNLGTTPDKNGNGVALWSETSSESSLNKRLSQVLRKMQQTDDKADIRSLKNVISNYSPEYKEMMKETSHISGVKGLAKHLYINKDKLDLKEMESREDIADADVEDVTEKINNIIKDHMTNKYKNSLASEDIESIIGNVDAIREESKDYAMHYANQNIRFANTDISTKVFINSSTLNDIIEPDKLLDTAKSYLRQDYGAIYKGTTGKLDTAFNKWYKENKIGRHDTNWTELRKNFRDQFDDRMRDKIDGWQKGGLESGSDKDTASKAWNELGRLADEFEDGTVKSRAQELLNWTPLATIADIRSAKTTADLPVGFEDYIPGPAGAREALGKSIVTQTEWAGVSLNSIDQDKFDIEKISQRGFKKRATLYQELSDELNTKNNMNDIVNPYAAISPEVDTTIDDILGEFLSGIRQDGGTEKTLNIALHGDPPISRMLGEEATEVVKNVIDKKGFSKGALVGVGIASALAGMIVAGMKVRAPEETAADNYEAKQNKSIHGRPDTDWAAAQAKPAGTIRQDRNDGANVNVRVKSRGNMSANDVAGTVSKVMGLFTSNVNITTKDDMTPVTKPWIEDQFVKLIKG